VLLDRIWGDVVVEQAGAGVQGSGLGGVDEQPLDAVGGSVGDPGELDREVLRAAEDGVRTVGRWVGEQPRFVQPSGECREGRLHLDAGQRRSHAVMDAAAEAEVLVVGAVGVEALGVGEEAGVPLPAASISRVPAPGGMVAPATSMSARAKRVAKCTGGS
jgi:hypothetical protein